MAKKSNGYVGFMDGLPLVLKIILALPGLDGFFYGIYRICKGRILFGVIWIIFGTFLGCFIDIVTIIMHKKPTILV